MIATVTADVVATDKVVVKVRALPPSNTLLALEARVTVGALSDSVIAILTDCVPFSVAPPPETATIEIAVVSVTPSKRLSSLGSKAVVPVVLPAVIVMSEIE